MLRGMAGTFEEHHKVQLLDEALSAAVKLSARYIQGRQLPDKAVSVLDTACARVAMSQASTPPGIEDARRRIADLDAELAVLAREGRIGLSHAEREAALGEELAGSRQELAGLEGRFEAEKTLVERVLALRAGLRAGDAPADASRDLGAAAGGAGGAARRGAAGAARRGRPGGRVHCRELDRHPCRPDAHRRDRSRAPAEGRAHGARRRPGPCPRADRQAHRDRARRPRQSGPAQGRVPARRAVWRRQDRDRAGAGRTALRRRGPRHHHQHVGVPGAAHRLDPEGRAARLCRLWRGRPAHRGGAAQALQRRAARRGREGAPGRPRDLLPGVRQGDDGGRRGQADRFPEHPDPPHLQCRLRPGHAARGRSRSSCRSPTRWRRRCASRCSRPFRPRCSAACSSCPITRWTVARSTGSSASSSAASPGGCRRTAASPSPTTTRWWTSSGSAARSSKAAGA